MKKINILTLLMILILFTISTSCKKDEDGEIQNTHWQFTYSDEKYSECWDLYFTNETVRRVRKWTENGTSTTDEETRNYTFNGYNVTLIDSEFGCNDFTLVNTKSLKDECEEVIYTKQTK